MSDLPPTYVPGFHDPQELCKMKYNEFGSTGLKISQLSLGTGGFCNQYGDYSLEECRQTLLKALKAGINYIDTAYWYGQNVSHQVLGKCLEGVPRQAYYLAMKVGRYEKDPEFMFDFSPEKTRWCIENNLKTVGVDYIDILQVHDIEFAPSIEYVINETLPVLKDAVNKGLVKFIGITGYPTSVLADCIKRSSIKLDMVLSYSRLTLIDENLKEYLPFLKERKLGVVNAAGIAMGLLSNSGPQPWHPAGEEIKSICCEAREYCKSRGVELARLAMHFLFNEPGPDTQLIGVNTRTLLDANLDVLFNGISNHEEEILKHLQDKVFSKLQVRDWEGVELTRFKEISRASN